MQKLSVEHKKKISKGLKIAYQSKDCHKKTDTYSGKMKNYHKRSKTNI